MPDAGVWVVLTAPLVLAVAVLAWWAASVLNARAEARRISAWSDRLSLLPLTLTPLPSQWASQIPEPLRGTRVEIRSLGGFSGERAFVLRVTTSTTPASRQPDAPFTFILLARRLDAPLSSRSIGLRPTAARVSWLDLYTAGHGRELVLLSFPSVESSEHFVAFGEQGSDVAPVVRLALSGTLPPDLSLLIRGQWLLLDLTLRRYTAANLESAWNTATAIADALRSETPTT